MAFKSNVGLSQKSAGFISNLSVRLKILAGFGLVLAILAIIAGNSFLNFTSVASGVTGYSDAVQESYVTGRLEANFLKLQRV